MLRPRESLAGESEIYTDGRSPADDESPQLNGYSVGEWEGDTFVVPTWAWHHFENNTGDQALLFSINDGPIMRALCFDREEAAQ